MRIAFLQDDFPPTSFGGAGISSFELARALRQAGQEVAVITTCRKESEAGESVYEGLRVFRIATSYAGRWRSWLSLNNRPVVREVERILQELRPDVVHAHNVHQYLSYASLKAARKYAKVVVWTARDTMAVSYGKLETARYLESGDAKVTFLDNLRQARLRYNPLRTIYIRARLRAIDARIAISHALKKALERNGVAPVRVIYNGVDTAGWEPSPAEVVAFIERYTLQDKKVLFFNGRLSGQKGAGATLEAFARVVESEPRAVLLIAGTADSYLDLMRADLQRLGVEKHVIFTGWLEREEIKLAYAAAEVVLMPSLYLDAFGRNNIEAMAARKPVVGTKFGGTPEIIVDGETGYIVDPRNTEEFAHKILDLLQHPEKARAFGEAGYARVRKEFSLTKAAQAHIGLYESLLAQKPL